MSDEELLSRALDVGERMVVCGAEIWRVEDSVTRICRAGGATRVDVFSITSTIIATIRVRGGPPVTQTRRILVRETNLYRLDKLNDLSRRVCRGDMDAAEFDRALQLIDTERVYRPWVQFFAFFLISGAFSIFFGGTYLDALSAAVIGLALKALDTYCRKVALNPLLSNLVCSALCGALAIFSVRAGLADSVDKIMVGNIMPLIPGVALTNAIRDLFSGDLVSGLLRLCDAILLAVSIACGFALAVMALGGVL